MENLDGDTLDQIGRIMGQDRNTMNQVKQMMKNPKVLNQVKNMMDKSTSNTPQPKTNKNKIGRNDPCDCGSGKKYKLCCIKQ